MESRTELKNDENIFWTESSAYQLEHEIDRGKFGVVYLVHEVSNPDNKKAIKFLNENVSILLREAKLHNQMAVCLKEYSIPPAEIAYNTEKTKAGLVMNYYPEGNLESFLRKQSILIDNTDERNELLHHIKIQIRSIRIALRKTQYVHGDIACRNILVSLEQDKQEKNQPRLFLSDYGHAIDLQDKKTTDIDKDIKLPVYTMASEAYMKTHQISKKTDDFATEIAILEASVLLFGGSMTNILRDEKGEFLSKKEFIKRLVDDGDKNMLNLLTANTRHFIRTHSGKQSANKNDEDTIIYHTGPEQAIYHTDDTDKLLPKQSLFKEKLKTNRGLKKTGKFFK
jgi:serine/threonine protein kinase